MFKDQVTTDVFVANLLYAVGILSVLLAAAGVLLLDMGLVRRKNAIDTMVQKLVSGFVCALGFAPIGYAIWVWQINQAYEVPNALGQAIGDWSIWGHMVNTLSMNIDPKVAAGVDTYQVFYVACTVFALFMGMVMHAVAVERMKPLPLYILSFVTGAVIYPAMLYLLWGSTSFLTNWGVHDSVGSFAVYLPLGVIALVMAKAVGPRIGRFSGGEPGDLPGPTSIPLVALGIALVLPALSFFALVAGYLVPGQGFVGISMTTSSMGMILMNLWAAIIGAALVGGILSYRTRNPYWAIAGPFVGYVAGTTMFDVGRPWYMFFIGTGAPIVAFGTARVLERAKIDESKIVPLVLGPAVYGAIVGGFAAWGTKTGGWMGIEEGKYAFQHAEITPLTQLVGVLTVVVVAGVVSSVVLMILKAVMGLRVTEEQERQGLDALYWPAPEPAPLDGAAAPVAQQPAFALND
jgi:ammonium transporter, Amt family